MSEKIVVAVDRDSAHRSTIDWAVKRAARTGAQIELMLVIQRTWGDRDPAPDRLLAAAAEAELDTVSAYAKRHALTVSKKATRSPALAGRTAGVAIEIDISSRWAYGQVAEELDSASRDANLLVVGVHRMRDADRHFTGSLGLRVASTAACPVVLVPHDWIDDARGVVVGVDGGLPAEAALMFAADEAAALDEPLTIVSSGFSANPLLAGLVPQISLGDRRESIVDSAAEVARDAHPQLDIEKRVVESSPPAGLVAASSGHRLLVIGSRGRHGAQRVLLGSVGHDVVLNLRTPVAIVRSLSMGGERTDD